MKNINIANSITATHKPIAYCLYRVSTVGQVDKVKNDIPMQKEECRDFAARHDWIIGKEFLEKGVNITFTLMNGDEVLMKLTVYAADENQVDSIKNNYLKDPAGLYAGIVSKLFV